MFAIQLRIVRYRRKVKNGVYTHGRKGMRPHPLSQCDVGIGVLLGEGEAGLGKVFGGQDREAAILAILIQFLPKISHHYP